jgi:2-octaprenyl-6-methoxyphenol hydroxylase
MQALAHAAGTQSLIEQRRPCRALPVEQRPDRVRIPLDDSTSIDAPLAIHAEGIGALDLDAAPPSQGAVIADLRVSGPASGAAFERFTREGPLALLPTPATLPGETRGAATRAMALVWCMDEAQATRRLAAPDDAFMRELQQAIGTRIGRVDAIGARRRYPLHQTMREQLRAHRVVALGNAAQTLHPVAGQGFNLGVRDCVTLSDALATHGADVAAALADHETRRGIDRAAIAAVTKWLPAAFATRFAPIAAARGAGLVALDLLPPLRRQLAYLLMFGVRA